MKKYVIRPIAIIIAMIILSQIIIQVLNNGIAYSIRFELLSIPCPDNAVIEGSMFIARKMFGNGNGMQYSGVLLIRSLENSKELTRYYRHYNPECEIELLQSSVFVDAFSFKEISEIECYYVIYITHDIESGTIPDTFFYRILSDCDIRGH